MDSVPSTATYDIIFAGAGATACIVAGRLAAADPSLKILLIEAGGHSCNVDNHIQPGLYLSNLLASGQSFSHHVGKPSKALGGRAPIVTSGRCVGGGSAVNFMVYTRAAASDYDDWEAFGNQGWGSADLIPLANKAETYQGLSIPNPETGHGDSGPIKISSGGLFTNVGQQVLATALAYDRERGFIEDVTDFHNVNGYGRWYMYIDAEKGHRSDTAHGYIYTQRENPNLKLLVQHRVVKVVFEGGCAVGVDIVPDVKVFGHANPITARATKMVVLSAGAFGSTAILERSGIGNTDILQKLDVPQIVDLPGVGENYNDHNVIFLPFIGSDETDSLDPVFRGDKDTLAPYVAQWTETGKGILAHNGADSGIRMRPTPAEVEVMGSEFKDAWTSFFKDKKDKPVMHFQTMSALFGKAPYVPTRKHYSMEYFTQYPFSVGRVHITNATDPRAKMDFESGILDHPADVQALRWAYKRAAELCRRIDLCRGAVKEGHPEFSPESAPYKALFCSENGEYKHPGIGAADIVYSEDDDRAIDEFHRKMVETCWHSLGTCAMKSRYENGVVDSNLNVYGVKNLKIADLSIAPSNVGCNTYNTAIIVGEKAATIIGNELGIKV